MKVKHMPCPECRKQGKDRSGDNLAVYPDGGTFCFSCGHSTPSTKFTPDLPQTFIGSKFKESELPQSARNYLSVWLNQEEINKHFTFDKPYDRVVLKDTLPSFYWGKSYTSGVRPKVYTEGSVPVHIFGGYNTTNLVIVEDPISAIKVSRVKGLDVLPLFGSHLSLKVLRCLSLMPKENLFIWLDNDKEKEGLSMCLSLRHLFKCKWVSTNFDPKSYRPEEIIKILGLKDAPTN